jgi:plastocyanin
MRLARLALLVALGGVLASPLWAQQLPRQAPQGGANVTVVNFDFQDRQLTIDVGTTVTWSNTADRPHTATDRGGTFDTNPISPGTKAAVTFSTPGRYAYFCRINPSKMNGVILVKPGAQPSRANRIEALDPALEGQALSFDPAQLTVPTGSSLVVANVGGKPHTLTADDSSFDTGVITPGAEGGRFAGNNAVITLNKPGTYPFHCEVHPQVMKGVLVVEGPGTAAGPPPPSAAPNQAAVDAVDFAFRDPQVSVALGGTVVWRNEGKAPHTATFDDVPLDTKTIAPGAQATLTAPAKAGSYSYKCAIHPAQMRGVLVVVGQNTADPVKPPLAQKPPVAVGGAGGGGLSWLALITAVVGAFLAGFGISGWLLRRKPVATP